MSTLTFTGDLGPVDHCPPYYGGPCKDMPTAIVRIITREGTVIAADGRETKAHSTIRTDHLQKIYPVAGMPLAFAFFGYTGIPKNDETLNLIEEAKSVEPIIYIDECDSLRTFVRQFAQPIQKRLASWRTDASILYPYGNVEDGQDGNTIAHLLFFGYHRGVPCTVDLRFFHKFHILQEPSIITLDSPVGFPPLVFGSKTVYKLLFDSADERFSSYRRAFPVDRENFNLSTAEQIAKDYIRACSDDAGREADPVGCSGIGGQIHIAKITPLGGFQWIVPPVVNY